MFHEVRFPDDISFGSAGGPKYLTDIATTTSGFEKRNINWQAARAIYNVTHGIKTKEQLDLLISFFRARKGRAYGFRFKDWTDYKVIEQIIAIGDGTNTKFQLIKSYNSGSFFEERIIHKPVHNSVHIYVNGVLATSGYDVDITTGLLEFTNAPEGGAIISADFEFDVPVRFDTDHLFASVDDYGTRSWNNIQLVEIKI